MGLGMRWLIVLVLAFSLGFPASLPAAAQSMGPGEGSISDAGTQIEFGKKITFHARVQPADQAGEVLVSFTPEGQDTQLERMEAGIAGETFHEVPAEKLRLAPFSQIRFHFEVVWKDGSKTASETYTIAYDDTRFTWQALESGIYQVHWNSGDPTLGQDILNVAKSGLQEAQGILPVEAPVPLRIYAYSSARALQEALMLAGDTWVAGHTSPELGLILISVSSGPEKNLELQRQVPHEIMHLLQYQVTGANFSRQPVWLIEGMASLAELYPNPEYSRVLQSTVDADELIPMGDLCAAFPADAGSAFRAYAQSESFVRFLHNAYGMSGIRSLMGYYHDGLGCAEGVQAAFGTPLSQLEHRWKLEALGVNAGGMAARRLSPYILLGLLLLAPALASVWPGRARKQPGAAGGREEGRQ